MALGSDLHSKELLLYPILQNLHEGILLADTSHHMIFYNESAEKILATTVNNFLGKRTEEIRPELTINSTLISQGIVQTQTLIYGEEINLTKDLQEIAADNFYSYFILKPVNTFNDFQLQTLLNNPKEGIAIFAPNSQLIYANELFYCCFDCDNTEQLTDKLTSLIPLTLFSKAIDKARPMSVTLTIKSRTIGLIYMPVIRNNHLAVIIVKSSIISHQENNWGHLAEEHHSGTATLDLDHIVLSMQILQ